MFKKKLIVANWKMNGFMKPGLQLIRDITNYVDSHCNCDVTLCPPATLLHNAVNIVAKSEVLIGSQDCSDDEDGAYTGEISAKMLADLGCKMVILGHSERREKHNENSEVVIKKINMSFKADIIPIVCVGESLYEYKKGNSINKVLDQLINSLPRKLYKEEFIIAYEPIWAIGTGKTPNKEEIHEMHKSIHNFIKERFGLDIKVLYGGSIKKENAKELLSISGVNGGLVGGASLDKNQFSDICDVA